MAEEFRGVFAISLRQCSTCGAVVADTTLHADWHDRLRHAVAEGFPVVDLADQDQ